MIDKIHQNILAGGKEYFPLALFLTLALFEASLWPPNFALGQVQNVLPGIATLNDVDVSARVRYFYFALLFLALVFLILCGLFGWAGRRSAFLKNYSPVLNHLSFLGVSMLAFLLFKVSGGEGLKFVFAAMGSLLFLFFVQMARRDTQIAHGADGLLFVGLTALAFSIGLGDILRLLDLRYLSLSISFFIAACLLILLLYGGGIRITEKLVYRFRPVYFLPLLYVFAVELFLTLNQHLVYLGPPVLFYLLGLGLLAAVFWFRSQRKGFRFHSPGSELSSFSVPVLLAGMVANFKYAPVHPLRARLFEDANTANAVMRWFEWGEIPFLEHLSSHLLSDYVLPSIYVLLNGYTGENDFYIYNFLILTLGVVISYYFLARVFKNCFAPIYLILFFPFFSVLFPVNFVLSLVSIFLIHRLFREYSIRRLTGLFAWCAFLLLWRPDSGVANLAATAIILILYAFQNHSLRFFVDAFKAFAFVLVPLLVVFALLAFWKGVDPFHPIRISLDYFGANQAHGFAEVAKAFDRYFLYQCIFFPILLLGVFLLVLIRFEYYFKNNSFLTISLLFLLLFYFSNLQRGLVRHSLFARNDIFLSSFLFLILPLSAFLIFRISGVLSCIVFIIISFFMAQNFKYPTSEGYLSFYDEISKYQKRAMMFKPARQKINRLRSDPDFAQKTYLDFRRFMDENFSPGATFIDFSNTPMLYFYTQRRVPSYFNQYLQNTVTDFLQEKNIERLKGMDIPAVVFANHPMTFWDHTDRVPNTLRYQTLAQYIFENYTPFSILNARQIWVRKGLQVPEKWSSKEMPGVALELEKYELMKFPAVLGRYNSPHYSTLRTFSPDAADIVRLDLRCEGHQADQFLELHFSSVPENCKAMLKYGNERKQLGAFSFDVLAGESPARYLVPMSSQYNWYTAPGAVHIDIEGFAARSITAAALLRENK